MKVSVEVNSTSVIAKLQKMPDDIQKKLLTTISALTEKLRTHIVRDKLMGQVLKRQTGRLGQSIQTQVTQTVSSVTGLVYSAGDVKYAAIHEFGGKTSAHIIEPRKVQALAFMMGGKQAFFKKVNHPGSNMPERSFMRSSLADMQQDISQGISDAVGEAVQ